MDEIMSHLSPISSTSHPHLLIFRQKGSEEPRHEANCPFCKGNENLTPPTLLQYGGDSETGEDWKLRVIANKFPAVQPFEDAMDAFPGMVHHADGREGTMNLSMLR